MRDNATPIPDTLTLDIISGALNGFAGSPITNGTFVDSSGTPTVTGGTIAETPLPATLPLFTTGLGALGLLGWRRKRKAALAA